MIQLIVWTWDGACQLDLLWRSIEKYALDLFKVYILFETSDKTFEHGYREFMDRNNCGMFDNIRDFKKDTLYALTKSDCQWTAFATDKTVFYRESPFTADQLKPYLPRYSTECFSFRLGLNTTIQDPVSGRVQPSLNKYVNNNGVLHWNNTLYHQFHNYGYPLSMDMHVFRTEYIKQLMQRHEWNDNSQLESALLQYRGEVPFMSSFLHSIAVSILSSTNKSELNDHFLKGYEIDLNTIGDSQGCHKVLSYTMVKK